ncbi:hydrolase [Mycobacterium sp. djl-10]|nr:hydrolase [Mycobacterium sp. djl-10]
MGLPDLLAELVVLQTISGDPAPQRRAMELCLSTVGRGQPGVRVESDLAGPHPWAVLTNDAAPGTPRLAFCCHVDTVPTGPLQSWSYAPFGAEIHDGRLVGRGATDMKAGLVAALAAVGHAVDTGVPVALILTSDEEVGSLGAQGAGHAAAAAGLGAVIVPEATANRVNLGHRGALWLRVATAGVAAHGSTPHLGRNAILALTDVIQRARAELPQATHTHLGSSTWNLGTVTGGSAPNIVAADASCVVDHRTVHNGPELLQWWTSQPEVASVDALIDLPALWTSADHPWVRELPVAPAADPVSYFTDGAVLGTVLPDVPVVIWGPGDPATMHAADEAVSLSDIDTAVDHYRSVVTHWGAAG